MIYLDYAASTPLHPALKKKLQSVYEWVGNMQSNQMKQLHHIEKNSQEKIARYFKGKPERLFFTSGATESISTAIIGACRFYRQSGNHIITFASEHQAVLSTVAALSQEGFEITVLPILPSGLIDYPLLASHITSKTIMVAVNGVCNETGLIQDIAPLIKLKEKHGFMIHLDACQMVGKVRFDIEHWPVDFITLSSHKCYGPQGIGALYIAKGRHISPIIHGTSSVRSGTMPIALIALMGDAYEITNQSFEKDNIHIDKIHTQFLNGLKDIDHSIVPGGVKHIVNVCFHNITELEINNIREKIYCQVSSACSNGLSHVLQTRLPFEKAKQCIRFSFGMMTTSTEIDAALKVIHEELA